MAPDQDKQLEKAIDKVLKSGDVRALDAFLQRDIHEGTTIKCSQQFLTKLDKLVNRSLDQNDSKSVSLGLAILHKCGNNLQLPGCQGLSGLIAQGLVKKWFEKCRQLWIQCGPQWDDTLFNLSEDFFDTLMVIHGAGKEGTYKITQSFLYPVGQLGVDPRIYILIQKEAIRKFNLILDKIPVELRKERKILTSQEASNIMVKLADQILEGGDYDLQTGLMEALCRMATPHQRKELADRWFSMEHVAKAFSKICDSEFETDCRKFLNLVNGMQGDRRRVYSYPCLEVHLDKHELLAPADEKMEEFWIDFNLSSHSISFYFSLADEEAQEGQWETICIQETEVQSYTVTEEGKRKVLQLKLSELVVVGTVEGSSLTINFSSSLDVLHAACSVFGQGKNKSFVGKTSTSVVKTTIKILMEENSSQVVPESQVSISEKEKNPKQYLLPAPSEQIVTPAKMRISESNMFVNNSTARSIHGVGSLSAVIPAGTPVRDKGKSSLEMVRSCNSQTEFCLGEVMTTCKTCSHGTTPSSTNAEVVKGQSADAKQANKNKVDKHKKNTHVTKTVDMLLSGEEEEQSLEDNFVPDTQPRTGINIWNWNKLSVSEMLMMPTQKISTLPRTEPQLSSAQQQEPLSSGGKLSVPGSGPISQKQFNTRLTQHLQQVISEKSQDCLPQESAAPKRKMSDFRGDSKVRRSAGQCASTLCTPKKQEAQKGDLAKGKRKGQMSLEADAAPNKASVKAFSSKALQERMPPSVKPETNSALSSKEKRGTEVGGSMVKLISSHYKINTRSTAKDIAENIPQSSIPSLVNRPKLDISWFSTAKRNVSGVVNLKKSHSKTVTNSAKQGRDIFAFNIDAPLNIGINDKLVSDSSAISSSDNHDSSILHRKKEQPVAKEKRYVKKHLFSDTDTDYAMTEVSWLRESTKKPKPKVNKYPRQAPIKPKEVSPHTSYESPDFPPPSPRSARDNIKPSKKEPGVKGRMEQLQKTVKSAASSNKPHAAGRRPRRAAATFTKSYKEPDTDDSQSESEQLLGPKYSSADHLMNTEKTHEAAQVKKKTTARKQQTKIDVKLQSNCHNSQSDSDSESEQPPTKLKLPSKQEKRPKTCSDVPEVKKKKNSFEKSIDSYRRLECNNQSDLKKTSGAKKTENVLQGTLKLNKKNVIPVEEQMNALKDSMAANQTSFCPSPPFIERMRSAERSAPALGLTCLPLLTPRGSPLPASPEPTCQDTPLPILLLPKPRSIVSSKGNLKPSSLYSAEKKHGTSKTRSIQSVHSLSSLAHQIPAPNPPIVTSAAEKSPIQQCLSPALLCPLSLSSQPLLTSTLLELDKPSVPSRPQSPFPEDIVKHGLHYGFSLSAVSQVSLSQSSKSSGLTKGVKCSPTASLAVSHKAEKTPPSDCDVKPAQLHMSGPSHKRHITSLSNSEEDEKVERKKNKTRRQHSPRMKPRKLFKSFTAEDEVSHVLSTSHTMSSSHWEEDVGNGDMDMDEDLELPDVAVNPSTLYQQFSSELKKKFQDRFKMMEVYNKHSLKTVQHHVSSLNIQFTKYRTQRLEQVKKILLEEIHKLEHSDTVLKSMEKDLSIYWKKQAVAYHSYQEQEIRRNETLKKALQSNVCPSLEYEQKIFASQMCLIRKDMKSVQDRLLCEMQEGEIQSMKRGLRALFFPDGARF